MQFALLGDIQFNLITYFDGLEGKFGADYAEHARIEGKPRLQFVGDKLDEWSLKLKFHQAYCDPETEVAKLQTAKNAHKSLAFVLANGQYKGRFVVTEVAVTSEQTDRLGSLLSAMVSVTLREAVDPPGAGVTQNAPAVVKSGAPLPHAAKTNVADMAKPNLPSFTLKTAVAAGREMAGAVSAVSRVVNIAKNLQNNPAAAIQQLQYGVPGFNQVAAAAGRLGIDLGPLPSQWADAAPVIAMSACVADEARSALSTIGATSHANLNSSMAAISHSVDSISTSLDSQSPALARLAAKTIAREWV